MRKRTGSIIGGLLLVALGGLLLANQYYPNLLGNLIPQTLSWPWIVIGVGALFIFFALITAQGGLAIPGSIVATVGGILLYQNNTGDWESWAFLWVLIPAAVGLGILIMAAIDGKWKAARAGFWLLAVDLAIFLVFWAIFRQGSGLLSSYWPLVLIAVGIMILVESLIKRKD